MCVWHACKAKGDRHYITHCPVMTDVQKEAAKQELWNRKRTEKRSGNEYEKGGPPTKKARKTSEQKSDGEQI